MKHARVGDVLRLERRPVTIDPFWEYEPIGIRSFGKGIFHYPPTLGGDLSKLRYFELRPDELVVSNIKAWEGAIAVASDAEVGCIASNRFLSYAPVDGQIDVRYAAYFFLSERGLPLIQRASPGSADRNRTLAIDRFEDLEIPLPDPDEQLRIVARLDAVLTRIKVGNEMLDRGARLSNALPVAAAHREDMPQSLKRARGWSRVALREVMAPELDEVTVDPGTSYPNVGILSFGRGLFEKEPIDGALTSARKLFRVRANQFIYSRLFAFEGAYAVVDERFGGHYVSNEFPSFAVDSARVDTAFLAAYFRSPTVWRDLAGRSKGLGVRRQRVQPEAILDYEVWLPTLEEQRRVARTAELIGVSDATRSRMNGRLKALGAAALNQAFVA